jgi:PhnB protein
MEENPMHPSIYLFFDGNCAEAFAFYEKALGGKIEAMMTYKDAPGPQDSPPEWLGKVMHASLRLGDTAIMASDAPPARSPGKPQGFYISLGVETPEEAERAFGALSGGGKVTMAMEETFFARKFGMTIDRFGIPWMIVCEKQH